jgi:ERF superfamily
MTNDNDNYDNRGQDGDSPNVTQPGVSSTRGAINQGVVGPIDQLAAALAKAQAAIRSAAKSAINPHYRSKYADLASVWDACRAALTENGLSVVQMPGYDPATGCVSVTTILLHCSGQYIASTARAPIAKADPQGVGSGTTYLRRYSLGAFVGVAPEDDDGEAASRPSHCEDDGVNSNPAVWPLGRRKGTALRDLTDEQLEDGRDWCLRKDKQKYAGLIHQIRGELEARGLGRIEAA